MAIFKWVRANIVDMQIYLKHFFVYWCVWLPIFNCHCYKWNHAHSHHFYICSYRHLLAVSQAFKRSSIQTCIHYSTLNHSLPLQLLALRVFSSYLCRPFSYTFPKPFRYYNFLLDFVEFKVILVAPISINDWVCDSLEMQQSHTYTNTSTLI